MYSKAYVKWLARIQDTDTPWSEQDIVYFRKAIGSSGLSSVSERADLKARFEALAVGGSYKIGHGHSNKGATYLLNKSLRKDGARRKGCKLGERELAVLRDISHHLFVGLYNQGQHIYESYLPVYRAVAADGSTFEYVGATYDLVQIVG